MRALSPIGRSRRVSQIFFEILKLGGFDGSLQGAGRCRLRSWVEIVDVALCFRAFGALVGLRPTLGASPPHFLAKDWVAVEALLASFPLWVGCCALGIEPWACSH